MASIRFSLFIIILSSFRLPIGTEASPEGSCDSEGPQDGYFYGETDPTVYIELNVVSESVMSFTMYLISRTLREDEESVITQPLFTHIPQLSYSFNRSDCSISFRDNLSNDATLSTLGDKPIESYGNLAGFYNRVRQFMADPIRVQLSPKMTATIDSQGHIGLMSMLWVKPSGEQRPVDWTSKVNKVNRDNGIKAAPFAFVGPPTKTSVSLRSSDPTNPTQSTASSSSSVPSFLTVYLVILIWSLF